MTSHHSVPNPHIEANLVILTSMCEQTAPYGVNSTFRPMSDEVHLREVGRKAEAMVWHYWGEVMLTLGQYLSVKYPPYRASTEG